MKTIEKSVLFIGYLKDECREIKYRFELDSFPCIKNQYRYRDETQQWELDGFQGRSNKKEYKVYKDTKGEYIKINTGLATKPKCIKIYKDEF